jgi:hypothetical protein
MPSFIVFKAVPKKIPLIIYSFAGRTDVDPMRNK